jgi:hypothetical protein
MVNQSLSVTSPSSGNERANVLFFRVKSPDGASIGRHRDSHPDRDVANLAHLELRRLNGFSSPARA